VKNANLVGRESAFLEHSGREQQERYPRKANRGMREPTRTRKRLMLGSHEWLKNLATFPNLVLSTLVRQVTAREGLRQQEKSYSSALKLLVCLSFFLCSVSLLSAHLQRAIKCIHELPHD